MSSARDRKAALKEIAVYVLQEASPSEVDLVPFHLEGRPAPRRGVSSGTLGFGIEAVVPLVLPVLIGFLQDIFKSTRTELAKKFGEKLASWLTSPSSPKSTRPLAATDLSTLAASLNRSLTDAGIAAQDAMRATDALVTLLVNKPALLSQLTSGTQQ